MKRLLLLLLAIIITKAAYTEPGRKITWEPVPGAWGYVLEIQNSGGTVIVNSEIKDNYYSVSDFEPGEYLFRIATLNLLKQKGESTGWNRFVVAKLYVPQLFSVSRRQMVSSYMNKNILVTGKNFMKESRFLLRGNGKEVDLTGGVKIISAGEAMISYKPASSLKGRYDFVVVNTGDVEAVLKNGMEIVEPAEAERFYFIGIGYMLNVPGGFWADYFDTSYTGGKMYFQFSFKNPVLQNFLFEAEADAVRHNNKSSINKSSFQYASLGLGLGYYYPFVTTNLEVFIKFNGGPVYTVLTLNSNVVDKKNATVDYFAMGAAGMRINIGDRFFIEPSGSWKTIFYKKEYLHEMGGSICVGFKI